MSEVVTTAPVVEDAIRVIRRQRVMLDSDLARFFGVTTKALNQTLQRNLERFPADFAFVLTRVEFTNLRSQIVTSSLSHGGRRLMPWAAIRQLLAAPSSEEREMGFHIREDEPVRYGKPRKSK